jgi:protein-S-isoprenylcysteine O-methyltransferase Ste14
MRDVFVGILCAIAFFMLSYKGYELSDKIAGNLGCILAVGVALFPMTPEEGTVTSIARIIGSVHLILATLFFLTLIYFSLFLFTKTDPEKTPTRGKVKRNKVYKVCGYTMGICIALIAIDLLLPSGMTSFLEKYNPIYWLETIAVLAFGISWLTKSEAILKDEI